MTSRLTCAVKGRMGMPGGNIFVCEGTATFERWWEECMQDDCCELCARLTVVMLTWQGTVGVCAGGRARVSVGTEAATAVCACKTRVAARVTGRNTALGAVEALATCSRRAQVRGCTETVIVWVCVHVR